MHKIAILMVLLAIGSMNQAWAFVGDKEEACGKPRFSKFSPPRLSEVAPGSKFSFSVYSITGLVDIETLEVKVKKLDTEFTVEDRHSFLRVVGTIPPSLSGTFARISLKAFMEKLNGQPKRDCVSKGGWLVKVTGDAPAKSEKQAPATAVDNDEMIQEKGK